MERVDQVCGGAVALEHELGHRAHLGAVVEGHHDHAEEQHGGNRTYPVVVESREAILRTSSGHTHKFSGTEVGRDECQTGNPCGQVTPRKEKVDAARNLASSQHADAQNEAEIYCDDQVVHPDGV